MMTVSLDLPQQSRKGGLDALQIERLDCVFNDLLNLWADTPGSRFAAFSLWKQCGCARPFTKRRKQTVEVSTPNAQLARCFLNL